AVEARIGEIAPADQRADRAGLRLQRDEGALDVLRLGALRAALGHDVRVLGAACAGRLQAGPALLHRLAGDALHVEVERGVDAQAAGVETRPEAIVEDIAHPLHEVGGVPTDDHALALGRQRLLLPSLRVGLAQVALPSISESTRLRRSRARSGLRSGL